jgi:hypothetical protein
MKTFAALAVVLSASLVACASAPAKDPAHSGEYFYNFENSYLTPDGKDEAWCINAGSMAKAMLPVKDVNGQWGTSHVVVRGKLSPPGSYGGLGRCKHVLDVTEIIEVSNMRGRDG